MLCECVIIHIMLILDILSTLQGSIHYYTLLSLVGTAGSWQMWRGNGRIQQLQVAE